MTKVKERPIFLFYCWCYNQHAKYFYKIDLFECQNRKVPKKDRIKEFIWDKITQLMQKICIMTRNKNE